MMVGLLFLLCDGVAAVNYGPGCMAETLGNVWTARKSQDRYLAPSPFSFAGTLSWKFCPLKKIEADFCLADIELELCPQASCNMLRTDGVARTGLCGTGYRVMERSRLDYMSCYGLVMACCCSDECPSGDHTAPVLANFVE